MHEGTLRKYVSENRNKENILSKVSVISEPQCKKEINFQEVKIKDAPDSDDEETSETHEEIVAKHDFFYTHIMKQVYFTIM